MYNNNYFKTFEDNLQNNEENIFLKPIRYILNDVFPEPNSLFGILFYCFILIIIKGIFSHILNFYAEKYVDEDHNNDLKSIPGEISQKILERRKQKAKEAVEFLNKIN